MGETRGNRWTPKEDSLFRKMAEAKIGPEIIATKLNRSVHGSQDTRLHNRTSVEMV
jgi:hypothetical protein